MSTTARGGKKKFPAKIEDEGGERRTNLVGRNGEPVVVQDGLLFESTVKDFLDVVEAESADGRTGQGIGRRRKRGVNNVHALSFVTAFVRAGGRFCTTSHEIFVIFLDEKRKREEGSKYCVNQRLYKTKKTG